MQVCLCVQRADWREAKLTTAAVSLQGRKHLRGGCFILKTQKCRVFWPESCAALVKRCVSLHLAFEGVCWFVLRGNGWHCNSAITPPEWWLPPSDSISLITLNSKWIVSLSSAATAQRNCWDIKSSHYLEAEDARSRSSCLYVNGGSSCVTYLTFDGKLSSRARILLECARVCWYQRCEIQMALLERECLVWRKDSGPRRTSSEDYFRWWQLRPRISASVTSWVVFPLFPLYNKEAALMMESFCVRLTKRGNI